ncbi:unnamed protein product [Coregonus sp. 'balchen']|nr:unnamed protein product [Coregonus sp. 'balchen']
MATKVTVKMATTMAAGEERAASEVLRALARHLNCLNEDSKTTRKRALEAIKRETIDKGLSSGVLQDVFTCLLKSLLKCLSDPMERCRETAIHMLGDFIRCVPQPEDSLPYLMPALTQRLGGKEILEPAEELRLSMVEVLTLTVEVCGRHLAPYLDDMMKILQRTIVDPFPDVKRESCKCTVHFAKSVPEHFHMQAESLVKPLMQTISHQHSRVRVSTIEATGAVIQYGTGKNVDDVLSHLAQRLFDDSPQVRKAVTVVVAADLWRQTGTRWEQENEDDLKDKMDFLLTPPDLYPAGVERPGLGCRELVVRNLSNLLPALARDVVDWVVGTRVKTVQLLYALLLHAEDHCTQHLQLLLSTLYRACTDPERDVVTNCLRSAKLLGTFVSPEVFLKLLLVHLETPSSSPHTPLMVLAAVLGGCSGDLLKPHLQKIADTLVQPDVCQEYQQAEQSVVSLCKVQGPVIGEFLPLLMPLLQNCLNPERDPEMRLHIFTMLRFCEHLDVFLLELLLPNLLLAVEERLSPPVLSALEEDSQLSRLLACRSLSTLLKLIGPSLHPDALNNIYPEVLKRLDDSSDEVRGVALRALGLWLASLGKDYNSQLYSQHLEVLFQQLLLHLDDPNSRVQDTVLEVLKTCSGVHPALLKQEVEAVRDKQRSPVYCDQLLQHIHSLRNDSA